MLPKIPDPAIPPFPIEDFLGREKLLFLAILYIIMREYTFGEYTFG
jgi:hypothetical protein